MSRKSFSFWFIFLPYLILLYASLYLAVYLRYGQNFNQVTWYSHLKAFSFIYIFWLLVFFIHGLFELNSLRRYSGLVFNLVSAMLVNLLIAVVYFYFQPNLILTPRRLLLLLLAISFVFILGWQMLVKYLIKSKLTEKVYLFSFEGELNDLEKAIHEHGYLGFSVLGHLNEQSLNQAAFGKDVSIILPNNLNTKPEVLVKFYELRKLGVRFYNNRDFYENLLRRVYLSQLSEVWFLENINYREKRLYNFIKRIIDLLAGFFGLIAFVISFPFIALGIKINSSGMVMFIQERVGKNGKLFKVYKYRSMAFGTATNTWTSVNDPRITKVGKFLRKSRLDELPQSINLILGNLSLVGPRPEQPHIVEELKRQIPFYDERHLVKPGLSGWAQLNVYAGSLEETKLKLQYDLYYIKRRSLLFDLEIIFKTLYYIFTWQGR